MATESWGFHTTSDEVTSALRSEIEAKNVLITGVSPDGLGAEVVRNIVKYTNLIVITGRSQAKLDAIIESIKKDTPNANLRTLIFDLESLDSARAAAQEVNTWSDPIHILINNAAVYPRDFQTIDGIESNFYGNHLSPFLFTNLILPRIRAAVTPTYFPRIINVSSIGHTLCPVHFDDINFKNRAYTRIDGYSQSKTANCLFSVELSKRLATEHILSYSLHPGVIFTRMVTALEQQFIDWGILEADGRTQVGGGWVQWKTMTEGGSTHIVAAFDPSITDQSGGYLDDCQIHKDRLAEYAGDSENAERLWNLSEELVGEKFL